MFLNDFRAAAPAAAEAAGDACQSSGKELKTEIQDARMAQEAGMRHEAKTETQRKGAEE